ncbi:NAD(P)-dependent oxidoreductase [Solirubrobacter ginsenosidimutans]|uniref:NAD(P)-dependent oxidoreductase n=1 Tax=Solirubrobacter ginsenosidimutans TaxID=490573 RepID=A0A9X3MU87_9ACTN|nr:NAD(P)-dependent oxidoreductase [Solirubrobacter ginsenosidimutans]MDA0162784.1 NAD(P)-dependent oxidoreductase [Solirubrobacter ginsenosidimutans]
MEPRRVLMTGACGTIATVLRPALRAGLEELRLSDLRAPESLVAPETSALADLTDFDAVQRAVDGVDAVIHLGAVSTEAAFEVIAGPNLHGAYHVFEACRRANVRRIVYASSTHASGMYPVGVPLDGSQRPRPDGLYGASKVYGEALGSMYADRFGLSVVCLRIGAFQAKPRELRELSTWLSHADAIRLVRAALTADDVRFAIVYGASANTRRWWPPDRSVGFVPEDDAEVHADGLDGEDYPWQAGAHAARDHGGWAT